MYGMIVELPTVEAFRDLQQQPGFEPVMHVDAGVQVEESHLDMRTSSPPLVPPPLAPPPPYGSAFADDAELADVTGGAPSAGSSSMGRPSPHPRRGASPWLVGDDARMMYDEDEEEEEEEEDDDDDDADADDDDAGPSALISGPTPRLELTTVGFVAGHPNGELQVGSIGFYRYEEPSGVFGLRPPPLRSNVVCIPAVPSWLSSADLIRTRLARPIRARHAHHDAHAHARSVCSEAALRHPLLAGTSLGWHLARRRHAACTSRARPVRRSRSLSLSLSIYLSVSLSLSFALSFALSFSLSFSLSRPLAHCASLAATRAAQASLAAMRAWCATCECFATRRCRTG